MSEAWKPLPECLDDDIWPCAGTAATVDTFSGVQVTEGEWPQVWIAHSVLHKPAQGRGRLQQGAVSKATGGKAEAAESVVLANPSGEALALL
jgi:hypothetical protein